MRFSVVKQQTWWWGISMLAIIASIAAMVISYSHFQAPLRPGLDFIGGTKLQLELECSVSGDCSQTIDTGAVRNILNDRQEDIFI